MNIINKKVRAYVAMLFVAALCLCSCSEENAKEHDPYTNWQARNAAWFEQVCDSARRAINDKDSIARYGEDVWKNELCEWRMYKSLLKSPAYNSGLASDSICVHIRQRCTDPDAFSPAYSDTVRINFSGWLLQTTYEEYDGTMLTYQKSFTKSYVGEFNPYVAAPQVMAVASTVEGFGTALQYMKASSTPSDDLKDGDIWDVYIPQTLAYGASANKAIPAYSTLLFRLHLVAAYRAGSGVPEWK